MFNPRLARLVDFRGLRTTVSCTFSVVSSATQGRPWPGSLWDTQPVWTNRLYHAKIDVFGIIIFFFCDTCHAIAIRETINNTARVPHRYTTPWWLAGFQSSSARVECHLAVWMKPWRLSATYEIVTAASGVTNLGSRGSKYAKSYLPYLFRSLALHTAGMVCPKTADFFSEYWQLPCLNACIYFTEWGWITLKPTVYRSLHKCETERLKKLTKMKQRLNILWATETTLLYQWFSKCARQTLKGSAEEVPRGSVDTFL
jgi:hypothetical protein